MNNSIINLKEIKKEIINTVIEELTSYATSDTHKKILKEELESKIRNHTLITELDIDQISVDAEIINKTMNELYIDMLTVYGISNVITDSLTSFNLSYMNYFDNIKAKINDISDTIESCNHSISHIHMPSFAIERFRTSDNFEKSRPFFKDRYGQWIPSKCYVEHDPAENSVTLPIIKRDNSLRYDNKVSTANLSKEFQLGNGFIGGMQSELENAIDESLSSYWSETILADAPFRVSFLDEKPKELFIKNKYYYGIDNGALCDLEINFESVNVINEITLTPCSKYPIDIVAIRYKLTDDEDEELIELVTPENKQKNLRQVTIDSKVSFRFPDILCKKIYILINQEHYERNTYMYNPADMYKSDLWFNSRNDNRAKTRNAQFKPLYYDRKLDGAAWQNINDRLVSSDSSNIQEIIIGNEDLKRKVIKYEYNYGFYNISCFNNHFDRTGIYVSKKVGVQSNIKTVKIDVEEEHQTDVLGHDVTDIEYYITGAEYPGVEDWVPILPVGKNLIKSELLFITGGTRAYLRFETEKVHCIMKNGEPLPVDSNEYHLDVNERTGKIWCVQIFNYDYDAIYSIKYEPELGHDEVDFSSKLTTSIESFKGEFKNKFELANEPFIDKTENYCQIKLTDISKNGVGTEIIVENVTDLTNQSSSYSKFDSTTNSFQFYIYKDSIYFNKPIPDKFLVDVSYRHLVSAVRVKALLRRNTTKDGWLTPTLKEIKYDIETF